MRAFLRLHITTYIRNKMQVIEYNNQYPNGLVLDVKFRFTGFDWLVTDINKCTYILRHFSNKRTKPFIKVHWSYNHGSIGIWHERNFITKKELLSKCYKVNEKITIYEKINDCPF
jgi:choline-glycine betaine transporter